MNWAWKATPMRTSWSMLGALGLGDIGQHFPDTDPTYKDASSVSMLRHVVRLMEREEYGLNNLDATVVAQRPRLAGHIPAMREKLSQVLLCALDQVNIKATTTERLGFCGRGEGIEAFAVVSLVRQKVELV
jgi:2-C-methyl-D-erythritol 2,4-cyclodiphosphate synthase